MLLLEGVDDRAGPEPRREDDLNEVLGVAQVDVDGREQHGQAARQHDAGDQGEQQQRQVGPVRRRVQHDHEDDHDDGLEEEEDAGRAHGGQGQDFAGNDTFFTMPALLTITPVPVRTPSGKRFHSSSPAKRKMTKSGMRLPEHDLEDDEVDGQRHGRRDHRPHQAEHRVLVLDLDLGAHQVDQQLARQPDLAEALAHADRRRDDPGDLVPLRLARAEPGRLGRHGRRIGHRARQAVPLVLATVCGGLAPDGEAGTSNATPRRSLPRPSDRSMTWSMKPYSQASSAVNQRSRSESVSMRSSGCPVWKAMRSAIMRLR